MYLTVQGQEDADILQDDLNVLQEWEKAWDMEFNPSICQVLHSTYSRLAGQSNILTLCFNFNKDTCPNLLGRHHRQGLRTRGYGQVL